MSGRVSTNDITGPVNSTISVVAGHAMNTYVMKRGRVPIPHELEDLIFPWLPAELAFVTEVRI